MAETSEVVYSSPERPKRVLICPPAPQRRTNKNNRRPSFFEARKLEFDDLEYLIKIKTQMVRNSLENNIRVTFNHTKEFSEIVIATIGCKCERIDDNKCVYYNN